MKVDLFMMPAVPASFDERRTDRPVGRSVERYQRMIDELRQIAVLADEAGIDAISTTEHHFHTEGGEANPNPVMLLVDLASRTKNIRLIPMSIVLNATNPIRAAEDIALLDHYSGGRADVCFARGYQKRWVQIMSQGGPTANQDNRDEESREKMREYVEIVQKCWSEDAFDFNGKYFQVPYPYDEGIKGWGPAEWTRKFGADGEIDEEGTIRKIGVIPKPLHDIEVHIPFTGSPETLAWSAEKGFTTWMMASRPEAFRQACETVQKAAADAGRSQALGQRCGAVRGVSIGDTEEEAFELAALTTGYEFNQYWSYFGFLETVRGPEDDPNKPVSFESNEACTKRLIDAGWQLCGTVDQVKRQLSDLHSVYGDGALEWFQWNFFYQGIVPMDTQRRQLELFTEKILPEFR